MVEKTSKRKTRYIKKFTELQKMDNDKNNLTPTEKLNRILRWQNSPITHPLTCGGENCEDVSMIPTLSLRYDVELVCPQCKRVQYFIPSCCYNMSIKEFDNYENKYGRI